jgi:GntR family transcriptional regulator, transcriptional repressor for pyruvate dehydrogenase complex
MFKYVQSEKFYMQIVNQVRAGIDDGTLKPGQKFPTEMEMTRMFGASRASVREAVSALEILGLIESRGGKGKYIKVRSEGLQSEIDEDLLTRFFKDDSAYELFEARVEIEPELCALAAERARPEDKERLAALLEKMEEIQRQVEANPDSITEKVEEYLDADRQFHLAIGASGHNQVLYRFVAGVHFAINSVHWKLLRKKVVIDHLSMSRLNDDHRAVLSAVRDANPRVAREVMERHLKDLRKVLF